MAGCRTNIPPANTTQKQVREKGRSCVCITHGSCMFPCTKMRKQLSDDCCQHSKVCMIRIRSSLPYYIDTQNAVCAMYTYIFKQWLAFLYTETVIRNACVTYTMMKYVLLRWTPSLNDRGKLKGECTDVKSWYCTIIRRTYSLNPHSLSLKKNFSCYNCPFK